MCKRSSPLNRQSGIVLLESLIAILIFSLGILAIVGMQTMAVKQVSDARYRSEAAMLANQLLGQMWVSNRTASALQTGFATGSAGYNAWLTDVKAVLPGVEGVSANQPTVDVTSGGTPQDGTVTITIYWQAPSEATSTGTPTPHKYIAIAQIK